MMEKFDGNFEKTEGELTEQVAQFSQQHQVGGISVGMVDFNTDINSTTNENNKDGGFMSDRQFEMFKSMYINNVNQTFGLNCNENNIKDFNEKLNEQVDKKGNSLLMNKRVQMQEETQRRVEAVRKQLGLDETKENPKQDYKDLEFE